jgi:hypothetical protein
VSFLLVFLSPSRFGIAGLNVVARFWSEMLLYWSLFGVAVGAVLGFSVSWLQPSERVTELIGELFCLYL